MEVDQGCRDMRFQVANYEYCYYYYRDMYFGVYLA